MTVVIFNSLAKIIAGGISLIPGHWNGRVLTVPTQIYTLTMCWFHIHLLIGEVSLDSMVDFSGNRYNFRHSLGIQGELFVDKTCQINASTTT